MYKIYQGYTDGLMKVVYTTYCLEGDYDEDRFVRNSKGEIHSFEEEGEAIEKLNEWYEVDEIDPDYRNKTSKFLTRD